MRSSDLSFNGGFAFGSGGHFEGKSLYNVFIPSSNNTANNIGIRKISDRGSYGLTVNPKKFAERGVRDYALGESLNNYFAVFNCVIRHNNQK